MVFSSKYSEAASASFSPHKQWQALDLLPRSLIDLLSLHHQPVVARARGAGLGWVS
jgi:hypothetical protein